MEINQVRRPTIEIESGLWEKGYRYVVGMDEVGRGAFAGPLVAAGVILQPGITRQSSEKSAYLLRHINDSKLLTPPLREELASIISDLALYTVIVEVPTSYINRHGIAKANSLAFRRITTRVFAALLPKQDEVFALIDGFHVKFLKGLGKKKQLRIIKGDTKSVSIAAASVVAKVYRDRYMKTLPEKYGKYNFAGHKGYGTTEHRLLIKQHGLCRLHRTSFNLQKFT